MTDRHFRLNLQVKVLIALLLVGILVTSFGVGMFLTYLGGYYDNLNIIRTGITVGSSSMGSPDVESPFVKLTMNPSYPGAGVATMGLEFSSWMWTNKSFPVVFGLI